MQQNLRYRTTSELKPHFGNPGCGLRCEVLLYVHLLFTVITEITKDSSTGSISATSDILSEEDRLSSVSGMTPSAQTTPVTPDRQFYDASGQGEPLPHGPHPPKTDAMGANGPGGRRKLSGDIDTREGYREGARNSTWDRDRRPASGQERDRSGSRDTSRDQSREGVRGSRYYRDPGWPADSGRPASGHHRSDSRPHSGKHHSAPHTPDHSHRGKKRDYFEKNEVNHHSYDSDGYKTPVGVGAYEDDSYDEIVDNDTVIPKKIRDDIPDSDLIDYEDDGGDSLVDSVPDLEYDENKVRIFIAMFDYDPVIMSPNPDAAEEELPFKENQLLKVGTPLTSR